LGRRYGVNPKTIAKRKGRTFSADLPTKRVPSSARFFSATTSRPGAVVRRHPYIDLFRFNYLRGEPSDIRPGTIRMIEAEIAKKLVEDDPVR
jgi:hypothetical protein